MFMEKIVGYIPIQNVGELLLWSRSSLNSWPLGRTSHQRKPGPIFYSDNRYENHLYVANLEEIRSYVCILKVIGSHLWFRSYVHSEAFWDGICILQDMFDPALTCSPPLRCRVTWCGVWGQAWLAENLNSTSLLHCTLSSTDTHSRNQQPLSLNVLLHLYTRLVPQYITNHVWVTHPVLFQLTRPFLLQRELHPRRSLFTCPFW